MRFRSLALLGLLLASPSFAQVPKQSGVTLTPKTASPVPPQQHGIWMKSGDGLRYQPANASVLTGQDQAIATDAPWVLAFNGSNAQHVSHGRFWGVWPGDSTDMGRDFAWEAWAKCLSTGTGLTMNGDGQFAYGFCRAAGSSWGAFQGGYNIGAAVMPPVGGWHYYSVRSAPDITGLNYIYVIIDGVPVGQTYVTTNRTVSGSILLMGGEAGASENLYLAQVRAFDLSDPIYHTTLSGGVSSAFGYGGVPYAPQRFFGAALIGIYGAIHKADFLVSYMEPGSLVDQSAGYTSQNITTRHSGRLGSGPAFNNIDIPSYEFYTGNPRPVWVQDPSAPFGAANYTAPPNGQTPASVPGGAKIFDSFGRADQTWAWNDLTVGLNLGATEGGSLGSLTYTNFVSLNGTQSPTPSAGGTMGLFQGKAVSLASATTALGAIVTTDSAVFDARVDRTYHTNYFINGTTGIVFRYVDTFNFWVAATISLANNSTRLDVTKVVSGNGTALANVTISGANNNWTTLRVTADGSDNLAVYTGTSSSGPWTSRWSGNDTALNTGLKIGLVCEVTSYNSALCQFDNFTVY